MLLLNPLGKSKKPIKHEKHVKEWSPRYSVRSTTLDSVRMDKLFGRKPAVPLDPTDRVQPLHFFENSALVQGNNMAVSLLYDEVLDPEKLRTSLENLVKREGWQRL